MRKGITSKLPFTLIVQGKFPLHQVGTIAIITIMGSYNAGCRVSLGLDPPPTRDKSIRSNVNVTKRNILCQLISAAQLIFRKCNIFLGISIDYLNQCVILFLKLYKPPKPRGHYEKRMVCNR